MPLTMAAQAQYLRALYGVLLDLGTSCGELVERLPQPLARVRQVAPPAFDPQLSHPHQQTPDAHLLLRIVQRCALRHSARSEASVSSQRQYSS